MSTCNKTLMAQNKPYPRTCAKCGLGPCVGDLVQPSAAAPELAYVVMWSYSDRSGSGPVSVHRTKAGADKMVELLRKHSETKQFTVEPTPCEP